MSKFTPTEIDLCKQIAEKYIKPMEYGDWWQHMGRELCICSTKKWIMSRDVVKRGNFPLWAISDCLEWLREKGIEWVDIKIHYPDTSVVVWANRVKDLDQMKDYKTGNSVLEALLKAVLEILKESK